MKTYTNRKFIGYRNRKGPHNERIFSNFSCCFRHWTAEGTPCKYLHSYVINFRVAFDGDVRFIFKRNSEERRLIQAWFKYKFEKITFVAEDNPEIKIFKQLRRDRAVKLKVLPKVSCEMFSKYLLEELNKHLEKIGVIQRVIEVETFENDKNSAIFKLEENE